MKPGFLLLPLLLIPALGGCTSSSGDGYSTSSDAFETHINGNLHIEFENGALVAQAPNRPDAHISASGELSIGDKTVVVTPAQQELLKRYYGEVASIRDDGIATGKAGVTLGINAVSNAIEGLFSNDSGKSKDADMQANSRRVEAAAQKLCLDLQRVRTTQGELGAQVPEFQPYAVFRGEVHCDKPDTGIATATSSSSTQ